MCASRDRQREEGEKLRGNCRKRTVNSNLVEIINRQEVGVDSHQETRLKHGATELLSEGSPPAMRKELKKEQKTEATLKYRNVCYIRQLTGVVRILGGRERDQNSWVDSKVADSAFLNQNPRGHQGR